MLKGFIAGNVIVYVIGLLLPVQKLAEKFAGLFKAKIGTFVYNLLTTFIYVSFYVVIFGFLYTALAIGFPSYFFIVVLKGMPLSFAVCYVVGIVINPIALKLSFWTCSKSTEKDTNFTEKNKMIIRKETERGQGLFLMVNLSEGTTGTLYTAGTLGGKKPLEYY